MRLEKWHDSEREYVCEMTKELDKLAKIEDIHECYKHYILLYSLDIKNKYLPIRVSGGTVGGIVVDEENVIKRISIDTNYVIKTYPQNVEEIIGKYIGTKLKFQYEEQN